MILAAFKYEVSKMGILTAHTAAYDKKFQGIPVGDMKEMVS